MSFYGYGKALFLACLLAGGNIARADDFEAAQAAKVAQNPAGVRCELRFTDGKTRFQQGETIRVTLAFSSETPGLYKLNVFFQAPPTLLPLGHFEVAPREGVVAPWAELPAPTFISVAGYVPDPVRLTEKPTEITVDLNEYLRFERPGTYRVAVTTNRVFVAGLKKQTSPILLLGGQSVTSNSVPLEIVPTDRQWAHAQVEAQRALWKQPRRWDRWDEDVSNAPSFRYLPTLEAMDAIIERLGAGERPRSSEDETYYWRISLLGFPDRAALIGAMHRAIARPDYPVSQGLLETLTLLRALEIQKKPRTELTTAQRAALDTKPGIIDWPLDALQKQFLPAEWQRAKIALVSKTGRARAMTLHSLLELAWQNPALAREVGTAPIQNLQTQVPSIFGDLPELPQQYLLDKSEWPRIKSPAMKAPLIALWKSLPPRDGYYAYFADAVLARLLEVAPREGRALAIREMAELRPRPTVQALLKVPGPALPQLDAIWLKHLQSDGSAPENSALLIGRFGSPAIESEVQRIYSERLRQKTLTPDVKLGLQTYLKRASRLHSP